VIPIIFIIKREALHYKTITCIKYKHYSHVYIPFRVTSLFLLVYVCLSISVTHKIAFY